MQTFEGAAAGRADRARVRGPSLNLGQHMQQRHAVRTAGRPIQPPQHGNVVLGAIGGELRVAYQPIPGYVGPDFFRVRLAAPTPEEIPVRVTVDP